MKWFKHLTESGDDPDIYDAMTLFGSDGYVVFFRTLELMSREFDTNNPGISTFSISFFKSKFRYTWAKTQVILRFYEKRKRFQLSFSNDEGLEQITIKCPKLKELCDEYTQKRLKKSRDKIGTLSGHCPEQEEEAEEEEDKEIKGTDGEITVPFNDIISHGSIPKVKSEIQEIGKELYDKKTFPGVFAFINKMLKEQKSERAILHTLTRCCAKAIHNGGFKKDGGPWAYCMKIIQVENGNYNELEYRKTTTPSN